MAGEEAKQIVTANRLEMNVTHRMTKTSQETAPG
jgi:hypothetical protein